MSASTARTDFYIRLANLLSTKPIVPLLCKIVSAAILLAAPLPAAGQPCDASPLLITNVMVWNAAGTVANQDVLVRDGRIASVGPPARIRPVDARILDGAGHTLLPGLIDSHLHFSVPGGLPTAGGPRTDAMQITARQLLAAGVTSGRLHLATIESAVLLKARGLDPCALVPRIQVGGPGLSGAAERDSASFQGARTVDEGVKKVEQFASAGVDWLAIHDAHRFAPGVLDAIGGAARKAGLRLMASGSTPEEIDAALLIRPATLDYFDRTEEPGYSAATLSLMRAQRELILVPTPGYPWRLVHYRNQPKSLEDPANFRFLSAPDREFVLATAKKQVDGEEARRWVNVVPTIANKMRQLRAQGLPIAIGSDAGSTNHFQANAIWWELEAWRAAGISHRDALIAATVNGAQVLRQADIGHLRRGARADFVLYRGSVEEGPFDVNRVIAVAKGGVLTHAQ